jgi:hypothetical protein
MSRRFLSSVGTDADRTFLVVARSGSYSICVYQFHVGLVWTTASPVPLRFYRDLQYIPVEAQEE